MITDYGAFAGVPAAPSWYGARPAVSQTRTPSEPNLPVAAVPTPATIGELTGLASNINAIERAGTKAAQEARIPGGPALEAKSSGVIGQELAGQVPEDVMRLLQQQGAEGAPGTGIDPQAAYLRALGVTSLGQIQAGQQNLSAALARNPPAPTFDPTTQLLTPGQAGNLALGQQQQNLAAQAEADRVALEEERLALASGGGGGGGYGRGGGAAGPTSPFDPFVTSVPNYGQEVAYGAASPYGFTPSTAGPTYTAPDQAANVPTYEDLFGA